MRFLGSSVPRFLGSSVPRFPSARTQEPRNPGTQTGPRNTAEEQGRGTAEPGTRPRNRAEEPRNSAEELRRIAEELLRNCRGTAEETPRNRRNKWTRTMCQPPQGTWEKPYSALEFMQCWIMNQAAVRAWSQRATRHETNQGKVRDPQRMGPTICQQLELWG